MILLFVLLAAAALPAFGGCSTSISDSSIRIVETDRLSQMAASDGVLLVDVRTAEEFARGRAPGAVNIRLGDLASERRRHDPRLRAASRIVVYGRNPGSGAARAMVKRLLSDGYDNVLLYEAGYEGWVRAGRPVERG